MAAYSSFSRAIVVGVATVPVVSLGLLQREYVALPPLEEDLGLQIGGLTADIAQ